MFNTKETHNPEIHDNKKIISKVLENKDVDVLCNEAKKKNDGTEDRLIEILLFEENISKQIIELLALNDQKIRQKIIQLIFGTGSEYYQTKNWRKKHTRDEGEESKYEKKEREKTLKSKIGSQEIQNEDSPSILKLMKKFEEYKLDILKSEELTAEMMYFLGEIFKKEQSEKKKKEYILKYGEEIRSILIAGINLNKKGNNSLKNIAKTIWGAAKCDFDKTDDTTDYYVSSALEQGTKQASQLLDSINDIDLANKTIENINLILWSLVKLGYSKFDNKVDVFVNRCIRIFEKRFNQGKRINCNAIIYNLAKLNYTFYDEKIKKFIVNISEKDAEQYMRDKDIFKYQMLWGLAVMDVPKTIFEKFASGIDYKEEDYSQEAISILYPAFTKYGLDKSETLKKGYEKFKNEFKEPKENCLERNIREIVESLNLQDYEIKKQELVNIYPIDIGLKFKNDIKIAIECDGEQYHKINGNRRTEDIFKDNIVNIEGWKVVRISDIELKKYGIKIVKDKLNQILNPETVEKKYVNREKIDAISEKRVNMNHFMAKVLKEILSKTIH